MHVCINIQQTIELIYCCYYKHVFRTDHLGLDSLSGGLSLKNTDYPSQHTVINYTSSSRGRPLGDFPNQCWACQLVCHYAEVV